MKEVLTSLPELSTISSEYNKNGSYLGMLRSRLFPDDPLDFIKLCVKDRKIYWTFHVNMRLKGRYIPRRIILESVESFEIIEAYPEDKYLPATWSFRDMEILPSMCFLRWMCRGECEDYYCLSPNPEEWEEDLKTRRRQP